MTEHPVDYRKLEEGRNHKLVVQGRRRSGWRWISAGAVGVGLYTAGWLMLRANINQQESPAATLTAEEYVRVTEDAAALHFAITSLGFLGLAAFAVIAVGLLKLLRAGRKSP